jgi:centromere protein C
MAIQTREVKGSTLHEGPTFRYAKLLSTKFFGTGVVDLPPGGVKRPKNSRKMHMSFFVVEGRVVVHVGPIGGDETGDMSRFSIGKGGFWQVPRGEFLKFSSADILRANGFLLQAINIPSRTSSINRREYSSVRAARPWQRMMMNKR